MSQKEADDSAQQVILVPDSLRIPHPLIKQTRTYLRSRECQTDHWQSPGALLPNKFCLNIRVTKELLDRSLRIYNAIIKHWESRGGTILIDVPAYERRPHTQFELQGATSTVRFFERFHRSPAKPSKSRDIFSHNPAHEYFPSGHLVLQIDGVQKEWNEGTKPIEQQLGDFCAALRTSIGHQLWNRQVEASFEKQRAEHRELLASERKSKQPKKLVIKSSLTTRTHGSKRRIFEPTLRL